MLTELELEVVLHQANLNRVDPLSMLLLVGNELSANWVAGTKIDQYRRTKGRKARGSGRRQAELDARSVAVLGDVVERSLKT
jgi:hypothetical protein